MSTFRAIGHVAGLVLAHAVITAAIGAVLLLGAAGLQLLMEAAP